MKCWKCSKEMDNIDGDYTSQGILVSVTLLPLDATLANIKYANHQLGKYSDGLGGCKVGICYECYIDGLFNIRPEINNE